MNIRWKHWMPVVLSILAALALAASGVQVSTDIESKGGQTLGLQTGTRVVFTLAIAEASTVADYVCDGTDDNIQFQAALNALPSTGGVLNIVSSGNFTWATGATVSRAINNVMITGAGIGTLFRGNGVTPLFSAGSQSGWVFRDLSTDAGGINVTSASRWSMVNVLLGSTYYANRIADSMTVGGNLTVTNITATNITTSGLLYAPVLNAPNSAQLLNYTSFYDTNGVKLQITNPFVLKANQYIGQTHAHSNQSDGVDTPAALATAYKNAGYAFMFITDHDKVTADPGVAGIAVFTADEESPNSGHILHLNATADSANTTSQLVIDNINAEGGIALVAHPLGNAGYVNYGVIPPERIKTLNGYLGIEVYNAGTALTPVSLVETAWDELLTSTAKLILGSAGDDCHDIGGGAFNKYQIVVNADPLSQANISNAIKAGNFYFRETGGVAISNLSVTSGVISVTVNASSTITFLGSNGQTLSTVSGTSGSYTIQGWEKYVRARIVSGGKYTWSQPIMITNLNDVKAETSTLDTSILERTRAAIRQFAPNSAWTVSSNGTGTSVLSPERIELATASSGNHTAGSTTLMRVTPFLAPYGQAPETIQWTKELWLLFDYQPTGTLTNTNVTSRMQIRQGTTEGELSSVGLGMNISAQTVTCTSYGSGGLGSITTGNVTGANLFGFAIHFVPAAQVEWYVNDGSDFRLFARQTNTTLIPSGTDSGTTRLIFSITASDAAVFSGMRIFPPYIWYAQN